MYREREREKEKREISICAYVWYMNIEWNVYLDICKIVEYMNIYICESTEGGLFVKVDIFDGFPSFFMHARAPV